MDRLLFAALKLYACYGLFSTVITQYDLPIFGKYAQQPQTGFVIPEGTPRFPNAYRKHKYLSCTSGDRYFAAKLKNV